jgi:hypothetical protein
MKSYRIFLSLFLLLFVANTTNVDAVAQTIPKKTSIKKSAKKSSEDKKKLVNTKKVSKKTISTKNTTQAVGKKKFTIKKNHSMSMYTKEIHPGDKMLIDNFGKQVGFKPKDLSKVKEEEVCSKQACEADVNQSTCYRAFRGDVENPEKGCQGYQRRTMGKKIGKQKKSSEITSDTVDAKTSKKNAGSNVKHNALDEAPLGLDVIENSPAGVTPATTQDSAAVASIGGAAIIGGLAMNTLADNDDDNVTTGNTGIHAMFAPAAGVAGLAAGPGAIPPAAACTTQAAAEALGQEIKNLHTAELATLGTAPVPGSENPQTSHQTFYNLIVDQLAYLSTITDLAQLNSGIDLLVGHLRILLGTNSIQSHFSQNLAHKIISAVSCVKNIGNPMSINQSIGWMAEKMAD